MNAILIACLVCAAYFVANGIILFVLIERTKNDYDHLDEGDYLIFFFLGLPIVIIAYTLALLQWLYFKIKNWLYWRKHNKG